MMSHIDISRIDMNLLMFFEAVLEEGHVGRAAARLNLSQSAVSHGLNRLREQLKDPLFLRTPKGVVPTDRAMALREPVADALSRIRNIFASGEPFDPMTSRRRFKIATPDAIAALLLPSLLADLRSSAPGIDIGFVQLLPGPTMQRHPWEDVVRLLDTHEVDLAVLPTDEAPARMAVRRVWDEDFVICMRKGHPFAADPSLERYLAHEHLVISLSGDGVAYVDTELAKLGLTRRVQLTVPNFMLALATLARTDLLAALPKSLIDEFSDRFGLVSVAAPLKLAQFHVCTMVPKVALMDAGIAWLLGRFRGPSGA
jgi:DNA-binding transcriptional LysR family regulator